MNDVAASSVTLAQFQPLRRAERILLRACASGEIARVGLRRPDDASAQVSVRAPLLAWLARGGGPGASVAGRRIQLLGAWIEGRLDLGDSTVAPTLWFYRCVFDHAPLFDGARLDGALSFRDCELPGLLAERCRIAQDLALNAGSRVAEEVRLSHARIGGDLDLARLRLGNGSGDARSRRPLLADALRVAGDVSLVDGFEADGEVRFVAARVRGDFRAGGATINGALDAGGVRRAALRLDRIEVGGDLCLDHGFAAAGQVGLRRARVGGDLDCSGAAFDRVGDASWGGAAALVLDRARIGGTLKLHRLQAPLLGASLVGTRVSTLADDASTWGERLVLDGFVYSRFGDEAPLDTAFRLAWLERQPAAHLGEDFRVHPWRRLIAVLQRMGRGHGAGEIALRREARLRRIGRVGEGWPRPLRWLAPLGHGLYGALAGYGWRPQRLAAWTLAVWLGAAALFWAAAEHGALAPVHAPAPAAARAEASFMPFAYSAAQLMPLVELPQARAWAPAPANADGLDWADGVRWLARLEAAFGWVASALLLAWLAGRLPREPQR